jgi:hypothetical protein
LVGRLEPPQHGLGFGGSVTVAAQILNELALASQFLLALPRLSFEEFHPAGNWAIHHAPTQRIAICGKVGVTTWGIRRDTGTGEPGEKDD